MVRIAFINLKCALCQLPYSITKRKSRTEEQSRQSPEGVSKILDKGVDKCVYNQREGDNVVLKVTGNFKGHRCTITITIV